MDIPIFDRDAVSNLTQKIESSLKKSHNAPSKTTIKPKHREITKTKDGTSLQQSVALGERSSGKKRLRDGQVKEQGLKHNRSGEKKYDRNVLKQTSGQSAEKSVKQNNSRHERPNAGVPAGSQRSGGSIKVGRPKKGRKEVPKTEGRRSIGSMAEISIMTASIPSKDGSILRDEVLALGGTEDDIALMEDVESGSELEGADIQNVKSSLNQDLQRLVKDLGINKAGGKEDLIVTSDEEKGNSPKDPKEFSNPNDIAIRPRRKDVKNVQSHLVYEPLPEWHAAQLPPIPHPPQPSSAPSKDIIDSVHEYAKHLLDEDNRQYVTRKGSSSSAHQFYSTIMSSGTLSDKISALTLSVQESPVHSMKALESLVVLARKRSRAQAVEVLGALKDLLGPGSLLPSDRKLKAFATQSGLCCFSATAYKEWKSGGSLPKLVEKVHLISWAYEDWLKGTYFEILKIIETWCNDEIAFARGKAVDYVYELLRDKPEQEANLLRLLVNKLGDSDKKIASKTSYNIIQLETTHPLMKPTIVKSIESDLLFRPGQSMHAKYYAVITLNQTVLSGKEETVARMVLDIYFSLFITLLAKPEQAKPILSTSNSVTYNKKGERQGGGGAGGKRAQKKLEMEAKNLTVDEGLQERMMSAVLTGVNRAIPFTRTDDDFFDKHLDTLFRITHSSNMNTSIQALMLIQQLCGTHQAASDRFYRTLYESLLDSRLLTSSKQAMYLNLLYRALRADLKVKRVKAFAKRLLQIVAMHQPPFACGVIYLLRELEGIFANLKTFVDQPEEDESDEEEDFRDVGEADEADQPARARAIQTMKTRHSLHYDGRKREPEYSNAERSCLWEIDPSLQHFHPSVALFASKLLTHDPMPAKPDLSSHTLIHFLDRFVYRNPKKAATGLRGASIMQPLAGGDTSGLLVLAPSKNRAQAPVNTDAFWRMDGAKVDADEVFFHRYFNSTGRGKGKGKKAEKKEKAKGGDDGDEDDEEDEEEIWKALVDSRPELEGSESEGDVDMDDLESAIEGSNDEDVGGGKGPASKDVIDDAEGDDEEMDFVDDEEALLGSDEEVPSDLDDAFNSELQFIPGNKDVVAPEPEKRSQKRRRLKSLPTFASVEDYAAMLDGSDEDD